MTSLSTCSIIRSVESLWGTKRCLYYIFVAKEFAFFWKTASVFRVHLCQKYFFENYWSQCVFFPLNQIKSAYKLPSRIIECLLLLQWKIQQYSQNQNFLFRLAPYAFISFRFWLDASIQHWFGHSLNKSSAQ